MIDHARRKVSCMSLLGSSNAANASTPEWKIILKLLSETDPELLGRLSRKMLNYLSSDRNCDFEFGPLEELAALSEVMTFKHNGFWECADTVRDVNHLNMLWETKKAKWKIWR